MVGHASVAVGSTSRGGSVLEVRLSLDLRFSALIRPCSGGPGLFVEGQGSLGRQRLDGPYDWQYEPVADLHRPVLPSPRMNSRVSNGEVKWIWELDDLQGLPSLAHASPFIGGASYERPAFEHFGAGVPTE